MAKETIKQLDMEGWMYTYGDRKTSFEQEFNTVFKILDFTKDQCSFKQIENEIIVGKTGVILIPFKKEELDEAIEKNCKFERFIVWYASKHNCIKSEFKRSGYLMSSISTFSELESYCFGLKIGEINLKRAYVQSRKDSCFIFIETEEQCCILHAWRNGIVCQGINPSNFSKFQ